MDDAAGEPTIRRATGVDGVATSAIFDAARTANLPFLPVLHSRAEDDAFFTRAMTETEGWVAVDAAGRPLGFAAWHDGMLDHLYVHPAAQGAGIGSALLARVQVAHPEGFDLFVFQRNSRARRFYERRGFHPIRFDRENEEGEPDIRERWPGTEGASGPDHGR